MAFTQQQLIGLGAAATLLLAAMPASAQSVIPDRWVSYLANYDAGPGLTRVNLNLRQRAPLGGYAYLIVTGPTYVSAERQGLPDPADTDRLNALQIKVIDAIARQTPSVYAGTFSHNFEQLHYVYVSSSAGIADLLARTYRDACPGCTTYTNIKADPSWSAYLDFLFPNQATRKHYGL